MGENRYGYGLDRRGFLAAGAGVMTTATLGSALPARAAVRSPATAGAVAVGENVAMSVDPASKSSWTVAKTILGIFFEVIERKPYSGIIAQHLANGSFEEWWLKGNREPWFRKTTVLYNDTPLLPELAYPWEAVPAGAVSNPGDGVSFEMPTGGVHGRRPDDASQPDASQRFQRVRVDGATGGVRQRVALPDDRTLTYDLTLWARSQGVGPLVVQMEDSAGDVVAEASVDLTREWTEHRVRLRLAHPSPTKFVNQFQGHNVVTPFGEFALVLRVQGTGHVDLDWATLMSGDAVRGKFNPTTLESLRELGVNSMRWPGGNYTSLYRWEYGIGAWKDRPVTINRVWGGLDYYYFGINEYLELCELVGMKPYINLGFNTELGRGDTREVISPEEVARCVEYCNGDTSTEMGALRAAHGHPSPWNVTQWQIGNEVWGPFQWGHVDAATYARRFKGFYDAMKTVDPSINVFASGLNVWEVRLGDPPGTPPDWNKVFLDIAGDGYTDGLDIHNYVNGVNDADERAAFVAEHDLDPIDYNQICVAYSSGIDQELSIIRQQARERGVENIQFTYGEFNVNPRGDDGWPRAHWETVANSAFTAGMYNTFIRHGDAVRYSHLVDYTIYHRPTTDDHWPISPPHYVRRLYDEPFRTPGLSWHQADVEIEGPTFDIPATDDMMATPDVPVVDAACLLSGDGQRAYIFAVNRDLKRRHPVSFSVRAWPTGEQAGKRRGPKVTARMIASVPEDDPFAQQRSFTERTAFQILDRTLTPDDAGKVTLELPPAATVRLRFDAVLS